MTIMLRKCVFLLFGFLYAFSPNGFAFAAMNDDVVHEYILEISDIDSVPVQNAIVECKLVDIGRNVIPDYISYKTNNDGRLSLKIKPVLSARYSIKTYHSKLQYRVFKDGYYQDNGQIYNLHGTENQTTDISNPRVIPVTLYKPLDYFDSHEFKDAKLKSILLANLEEIRSQAAKSQVLLRHKSIRLLTFKGRTYLTIALDNAVTYNELKYKKNDVAGAVFDEVVTKNLSALYAYTGDLGGFFGYNFEVTAYVKDFSKKYGDTKSIQFEFLIPKQSALKFCDKDISRQSLLDQSIVIMDNERIDVKL